MADLFSYDPDPSYVVQKLAALEKEIPKKAVKMAAKAGSSAVFRFVRAYAPVRTGDLRGGIIENPEKSKSVGKAVYDVMMDPGKNHIFQRPVAKPDRLKGSYAYYPASQEYGFFRRRPGGGLSYEHSAAQGSHGKVKGKHYFARGTAAAEDAAVKSIVSILGKEIDKIMR